MTQPLQKLSSQNLPRFFLISLLATLVVFTVISITGKPLQNNVAPAGIVSYELAATPAHAAAILASWNDATRVFAGFNLGLDYLFMLCYAVTFSLSIVWAGRTFQRWGQLKLARLGWLLAWGAWLAALLDAMENVGLIIMLLDRVAAPWPQISAFCATTKFGLLTLGLLYVFAGLFFQLSKGFRSAQG